MKNEYQTPPEVAEYMASLIPKGSWIILEPTKGNGNLYSAIRRESEKRFPMMQFDITAPEDFFLLDKARGFDCVVMNPPFSTKSAILTNAPVELHGTGMLIGYHILAECMKKAPSIIALMPWFTIIDSDVRLRILKSFGLISVTALPRKTFGYARIQTMILQLQRGYTGPTEFRTFNFKDNIVEKKTKIEKELLNL